jgi:hypothetical protein
MTGERASVFGNDDFDVSGFAPKPIEKPAAKPEQVRAVSEAASFRSREPKPAPITAAPVEAQKREQRRYRTGRNVQLNIKVRPEDLEEFLALCDRCQWVQGYGFQQAIEALKREQDAQK